MTTIKSENKLKTKNRNNTLSNNTKQVSPDIPFSQELLRKGVHLISISIPIGYYYATKELAFIILIPVTIFFLIIDIFGRKKTVIQKLLLTYFGKMLRPHEVEDRFVLNGASWVLLSALLCILVFPKLLVVTGFAVLILSDSSAAIFGRKFGKHKYYHKSFEGSFAFFVAGLITVFYIAFTNNLPWTFYVFGAIAVLVGTVVEALSASVIKIDDNLTIPVSIGIVLWLGNYFAALLNLPYI